MTKLDRIIAILDGARRAIDEFEAKALKGEASYRDRVRCADLVDVHLEEARLAAAHVEPQAGEVVEVRGPNVTITVKP